MLIKDSHKINNINKSHAVVVFSAMIKYCSYSVEFPENFFFLPPTGRCIFSSSHWLKRVWHQSRQDVCSFSSCCATSDKLSLSHKHVLKLLSVACLRNVFPLCLNKHVCVFLMTWRHPMKPIRRTLCSHVSQGLFTSGWCSNLPISATSLKTKISKECLNNNKRHLSEPQIC